MSEFTEAMAQRSDKELAQILTMYRNDYLPIAIEAAELESKKRGLDITKFVTKKDIEDHKKIEKKWDSIFLKLDKMVSKNNKK